MVEFLGAYDRPKTSMGVGGRSPSILNPGGIDCIDIFFFVGHPWEGHFFPDINPQHLGASTLKTPQEDIQGGASSQSCGGPLREALFFLLLGGSSQDEVRCQ